MKNRDEIKKILVMAILAGKIMLQNGAETYRVEDTIKRICKSRDIKFTQAFVTPTGIFLSVEYKDELFSYIQRIKSMKIDLEKIALINDFSRKFVNSDMTVKEGMEHLDQIKNTKPFPKWIKFTCSGLASGFFTLLFGGNFQDLLSAFFAGFIVVLIIDYLNKLNITFFLSNVIGGVIATAISLLFSNILIGSNIDKIIIGSIMPLVPGVSITNAIRDSISGDFLSGVSRTVEAVIIALGIAFGVGSTLKLYGFF